MTSRRALALSAIVISGALALAGCASGSTPPAATPAATGDASALEVWAGWLDGGRAVAVVTQGSSSCVPTASAVDLQADGSVAVTLDNPTGDVVCTADYAPRASLVSLPAGVDATQKIALTVSLDGGAPGETVLSPYAGPEVADYAPSAGWVGDGMLAILTWGSSSCAPTVKDAVAGQTDIAVTFADLPDGQPCTMDMAPRVALAHVDGATAASGMTATLSGGDAQFATPVTIPIAG